MYDVPQVPLVEDGAYSSSDIDVYREDESSNVYVWVQFDDNELVTPLHRLDVESTQIVASSLMGQANHNLYEKIFINKDNNKTYSDDNTNNKGSMC